MGMKRDKKDDEDNGGVGGGHPYSNLEKTSVLQEARYQSQFEYLYLTFTLHLVIIAKYFLNQMSFIGFTLDVNFFVTSHISQRFFNIILSAVYATFLLGNFKKHTCQKKITFHVDC